MRTALDGSINDLEKNDELSNIGLAEIIKKCPNFIMIKNMI